MNAITDLLENLRDNLVSVLGIFLIVVIIIGYLFFAISSILPQWQLRSELIPQVAVAELEATRAAQSSNTNIDTLRAQIKSAPTRLVETASRFMVADAREAQILDSIYQNAETNGVEIAELQIQSAPNSTEDNLYNIRRFQIDVAGPLPQLLTFLSNIEETSLPGFVLTNVLINQREPSDSLVMDVLLYTSPYVDDALAVTLVNESEAVDSATPTPETEAIANGRYEVHRGDTLLSISLQYNVSMAALKSANSLSDNTIFPGQELLIP